MLYKNSMFNKSTKERKMRKLSEAAQVNKLLKKKAKELGLTVTGSSKNYSMGDHVKINVLKGSDNAFKILKEYSYQFEYGKFDGMNDIYEITNSRDDIPQTKYLFIQDERANQILEYYDENIFRTEKKWMWFDNELRCYEWIKQIKDEFKDNWQKGLMDIMEGKIEKYKVLNA